MSNQFEVLNYIFGTYLGYLLIPLILGLIIIGLVTRFTRNL